MASFSCVCGDWEHVRLACLLIGDFGRWLRTRNHESFVAITNLRVIQWEDENTFISVPLASILNAGTRVNYLMAMREIEMRVLPGVFSHLLRLCCISLTRTLQHKTGTSIPPQCRAKVLFAWSTLMDCQSPICCSSYASYATPSPRARLKPRRVISRPNPRWTTLNEMAEGRLNALLVLLAALLLPSAATSKSWEMPRDGQLLSCAKCKVLERTTTLPGCMSACGEWNAWVR